MTVKVRTTLLIRFQNWYRRLWFPQPPKPPYNHICRIGDPVLRTKAQEVDLKLITSPEIKKIITALKKVLKKEECVGLSAPQIGCPLRIIVLEFSEKSVKQFPPNIRDIQELSIFPLKVFINPTMHAINNRKIRFYESCGSIDGYLAVVPRFHEVKIKGWNEMGEEVEWQVKGWPARIVQHEMDHLEGKVYTDIMDPLTLQYIDWYFENFPNRRKWLLRVRRSSKI